MIKDVIEIYKGTEHYRNYLSSLTQLTPIDEADLLHVSDAIFYHMYSARYGQWSQRFNFNRLISHSMSDYFQDLVAFFLKCYFGSDDYEILLEKSEILDNGQKKQNIRPDILIKKNNENHAAIEIKTTIGWDRSSPEGKISKRISDISKSFQIKKSKIVYILETPQNVNKRFLKNFFDENKNEPKKKRKGIYNKLYPLFYKGPDSSYWDMNKSSRTEEISPELTESEILEIAKKDIITPFEDIISIIK